MLLLTKLLLGMCLKKTDSLKLQPESKTFSHLMLNSYRKSTPSSESGLYVTEYTKFKSIKTHCGENSKGL